jgi:hypothetical protein
MAVLVFAFLLIRVVATLDPFRVGVVVPEDVADWLRGEEWTKGEEDRSRSRLSSCDDNDDDENRDVSRFLPLLLYCQCLYDYLTPEGRTTYVMDALLVRSGITLSPSSSR